MTLYDSSVLRYCHYVTWQSHLVTCTARKRSCEKVMFLHESVNLFTGRVTPPRHHTLHPGTMPLPGTIHRPSPVPKKRVVRILLECLLVG